jgi:hypothetical protein
MLKLLPLPSKFGLVAIRTKLSKLSGTQVEKFLLAAVLKIWYVYGNQKRPSHIMFFTTLNSEFTKFNGVVREQATPCLRLVAKMVG